MNDRRTPAASPSDPSDEGELLAAYLSGDLDETAAARLEQRLEDEPDLARRLDATARVLVALRGVDDVEPPEGVGERLRERLAAEQATTGPAAVAPAGADRGADAAAGGTVTSLAARRRVPWQAVGGIAAGVVALAVIGGTVLQGLGGGGADMAQDTGTAEESAEAPADDMVAAPEPDDADLPRTLGEHGGEAQDDPTQSARADAPPVIVAGLVTVTSEAELVARYQGLPEATSLLGEPTGPAANRAAEYRAVIAEAPAFEGGVRPDACLSALDADPAAVPVRTELVSIEEDFALVYVVVSATRGSEVLDIVQAWALDPGTCAPVMVRDVSEP